MIGKRKYKSYLTDSTISMPKTSCWRYKKRQKMSNSQDDEFSETSSSGSKRRGYLQCSSKHIPRQTLWYWKRKDGQKCDKENLPECNRDVVDIPDSCSTEGCSPDEVVNGSDYKEVDDEVASSGSKYSSDENEGNSEVENDEYGINNEIEVRATDNGSTCEEIRDLEEDDEVLDDSIPHHISDVLSIEDDYIEDDYIESDSDRDDECGDNTEIDKEDVSLLYDGSSISTNASWYSMMYFAVKNRLSYKAIKDLITLIKAHCPTEQNYCPKSFYEFKKYFESLNKQILLKFCSVCMKNLEQADKTCSNRQCIKQKARVCDLALFPIEERLKQLYEEHDKFIYPFIRKNDDATMRDVHDGSSIRNLMSEGGFLSCPENTGLALCSDGVPVYKSSKGSLWPVYLMVTSIPPQKRMKVDNLIIAALWHGPTKPSMDLILQHVLASISHLENNGISYSPNVVIRAKLLMAIFDLPAKSSVTNTKQFNGEYGCLYCEEKGEVCNRARIYRPNPDMQLRDSERMKHLASLAESTGQPQVGVKGPCILGDYLEIPSCIPIDYMHSTLEGVFKQLMRHWFDPKYHSQPYSLLMGTTLGILNVWVRKPKWVSWDHISWNTENCVPNELPDSVASNGT
uniref:Uncharacterized protein n=1 Tax=Amphimedon queenslandica TaxID=400682 RepID=A0A1X7TR45_AMPQE